MTDFEQNHFARLFEKRSGRITPGLSRLYKALPYLGEDLAARPSVLIGGTNGKGGTAGYLWHSLRRSRINTGLFTSPHLVKFGERFLVEKEASDERLLALWRRLRQILPENVYEPLTFFELTTLMALMLFKEEATDLDILEVGLGGRLDSTNIASPLASVIVSIGQDHMAYLGDSIAAITKEKLGIRRDGCPMFTGLIEYDEAKELIEQACHIGDSPLYRLGTEFYYEGEQAVVALPGLARMEFPLEGPLARAPSYIKDNFLLATAVHHWLYTQKKVCRGVTKDLTEGGILPPPCLAGRFQPLRVTHKEKQINVLLDVCHNVESVRRFCASLSSLDKRLGKPMGLVCILEDKDISPMLDILKGFLDPLVLFKIGSDRCFSDASLDERHKGLPVAASFSEGLSRVLEMGGLASGPLVICGSVLAVGRVLEYFSCHPQGLSSQLLQGGYHHPGS